MPYSFFDLPALFHFNLSGTCSNDFINFLSNSKYNVAYRATAISHMIMLLNEKVLISEPNIFFCGAKKCAR